MIDATNGNRGAQAYRWLVAIGMALITGMSWRVLDSIDRMSAKIEALQIQVATLSGTAEGRINALGQRLDGGERRNDTQDLKIDELQRQVWRLPETRSP